MHSIQIETIGDAFVCAAGIPDAEDSVVAAEKVAKMALAMIEFTRSFTSRAGIRVRIRIGIHSGPVVAAVVGNRMPRYSVFGGEDR